VVVDSCISTEGVLEMYADPTARWGPLLRAGVPQQQLQRLLELFERGWAIRAC